MALKRDRFDEGVFMMIKTRFVGRYGGLPSPGPQTGREEGQATHTSRLSPAWVLAFGRSILRDR